MEWNAEQVRMWLDIGFDGNKSRAAKTIGVSRSYLDAALENGADQKHVLAMMMIEKRIDVRTGSHAGTDQPLEFVVCTERNQINHEVFLQGRANDGSLDVNNLQHWILKTQDRFPDARLSYLAERVMELDPGDKVMSLKELEETEH